MRSTLGCTFGQYYGMTQIGGSATFLADRFHDLDRPDLMNSVGKPLPGVSLEIHDSEGRPVATGEAGRNLPADPDLDARLLEPAGRETRAAVDADGWYRTGDGRRLDADSFLYLTDRIKDMIITGGENVYPNHVEEVLARHPAVAASAVIGVPHPRWGEAVVALADATPRGDRRRRVDRLRPRPDRSVQMPQAVHFVDALPPTASGMALKPAQTLATPSMMRDDCRRDRSPWTIHPVAGQ